MLKPPDRMPLNLPVSEADLQYVAKKLAGGKDAVIDSVHIEVFDLLNAEERENCKKVDKDVLEKAFNGVISVLCDKTEKMQRSDGSTTWVRLLKWVEYKLVD